MPRVRAERRGMAAVDMWASVLSTTVLTPFMTMGAAAALEAPKEAARNALVTLPGMNLGTDEDEAEML